MSRGMRFSPGAGLNDRRETPYADAWRYRSDTRYRMHGFGGGGVNPYFDDRWRIRDGGVSGWGGFRGQGAAPQPEYRRRSREEASGPGDVPYSDDRKRFKEDEIPEGRGHFVVGGDFAYPVVSPDNRRFDVFPGRGGFRSREAMVSPEETRRFELFPRMGGVRGRETGPSSNDWRQDNENTRGRQQLFPSEGFRGQPSGLDTNGRAEKHPSQGENFALGGNSLKLEGTPEGMADKGGEATPAKVEGAGAYPAAAFKEEKGEPVVEAVADDEEDDGEDASLEEEEGTANKLSPRKS